MGGAVIRLSTDDGSPVEDRIPLTEWDIDTISEDTSAWGELVAQTIQDDADSIGTGQSYTLSIHQGADGSGKVVGTHNMRVRRVSDPMAPGGVPESASMVGIIGQLMRHSEAQARTMAMQHQQTMAILDSQQRGLTTMMDAQSRLLDVMTKRVEAYEAAAIEAAEDEADPPNPALDRLIDLGEAMLLGSGAPAPAPPKDGPDGR